MGGGSPGQIKFKFNPKEYTIQKNAEWKRSASKSAVPAAKAEFTGSGPRSMSLEMFLDATDSASGDVTKDIEALFKCLIPTKESIHAKKPSPPNVRFRWGEAGENFLAYIKSVSAKYTLFRTDGKPIRAACTVSLEEFPEPADSQNPTSGSLETHRSRTVVAGDTLASIAYGEYQNPTKWRIIAEANEIDDPMRLSIGTRLLIPPLDGALAESNGRANGSR